MTRVYAGHLRPGDRAVLGTELRPALVRRIVNGRDGWRLVRAERDDGSVFDLMIHRNGRALVERRAA